MPRPVVSERINLSRCRPIIGRVTEVDRSMATQSSVLLL